MGKNSKAGSEMALFFYILHPVIFTSQKKPHAVFVGAILTPDLYSIPSKELLPS
jgi:hypothetical protein